MEEDKMKKIVLIGLVVTLFIFVGSAIASPPDKYSEETVTGHSSGNHELDCTVIRPWRSSSGPASTQYPVIVWANGWGGMTSPERPPRIGTNLL